AEVLLERDRGEWVREMLAAPLPEDATSLMIRFNLLVRDGRQAVHRDKHHHSNEVDFTLQAMARHLD
ncbi:MAG: hypothetical protein JXA69_00005, partial [Phycisphaerae bacterium]|nr:hypothetical protein [Phycisphaerae bacterium]